MVSPPRCSAPVIRERLWRPRCYGWAGSKGWRGPPLPYPSRYSAPPPPPCSIAGANADCRPEWLVQFAVLGAVYARECFGIGQPRVGILTIGEEAGKGNALIKAACELLAAGDWASGCGARYIGNVEGRDLMIGTADVIVTDGFTGNVVLKSMEGGYAVFEKAVRQALRSTPEVSATARVVDKVLEPLFAGFDPVRTGGALLLGTRGVTLISHGSSSAIAIAHAIATADELVKIDIVGSLRKSIVAGSDTVSG